MFRLFAVIVSPVLPHGRRGPLGSMTSFEVLRKDLLNDGLNEYAGRMIVFIVKQS